MYSQPASAAQKKERCTATKVEKQRRSAAPDVSDFHHLVDTRAGLSPARLAASGPNVVPPAFAVTMEGFFQRTRRAPSGRSPGRASPTRNRRDVLPMEDVVPSAFGEVFLRKASALARPRRNARTGSWLYNSIASINPTQWAGFNSPAAKLAMISKTASEKPPTFRMSSRSAACVEA